VPAGWLGVPDPIEIPTWCGSPLLTFGVPACDCPPSPSWRPEPTVPVPVPVAAMPVLESPMPEAAPFDVVPPWLEVA
jgi:hypothetical protein